jgi:hypothetical protein
MEPTHSEVIMRQEIKAPRQGSRYKEDTSSIEITFPLPVNISQSQQRRLVDLISEICDCYEERHPGRVMWPFGIGSRITYMPMTQAEEQERGMEFDNSCFSIECSERADYDAICTKCGKPQGDHKDHIVDPPAGDCDFEIRNS